MDEEESRIAQFMRDQAAEMERQRAEDESSKANCWLVNDPQWGGCCCECESRVSDYDRESRRRVGFICMAPEFFDRDGLKIAYSHWDAHGFCEMFMKRIPRDGSGNPIGEATA